MKKLAILGSFILGTCMFSNAQEITTPQTSAEVGTQPIQKGNWMIGGSIGSAGYSFEGETFNINLSPRAGYFISDGIAIGAEIGGGLQTVKDGDNVWSYGVSPFIRYYFPEGASSTGRFFGQGSVGISGASAGSESDTSFAFGVNGGYAHFITDNVALEGMVGYNYSKSDLATVGKQSGLGFSVGFQIYLPGR